MGRIFRRDEGTFPAFHPHTPRHVGRDRRGFVPVFRTEDTGPEPGRVLKRDAMTPALHVEIQNVLDRQGTSDLALEAIARKLLTEFDARFVLIHTPDAATGMLKLRCHAGLDRDMADKVRFLCRGKGLSGTAVSLRRPIQGWQHPDATCAEERDVFSEGTLHVPLLFGDAPCGVLGIAKTYHTRYAPDEIAALAAVARLIASYLH